MINLFLNFISILYEIKLNKPNVVHFFLPLPYILGGFASIFLRVPIKIMSRRSRNFYQKKFYLVSLIERFLHKRMNFILANSEIVYSDLQKENVSNSKLGLIYNGININKIKTHKQKLKIRSKLSLSKDDFIINCTANLIKYKGHEDLFNALSLIKKELGKSWKLLCVGKDFNIQKKLNDLALNLGLQEHILFLGSNNNPSELMSISDIGVLVSHEEGFSNSILEYMSHSLAVVATNVGGNEFVLNKNECGEIVDVRDIKKIGQRIKLFFNNKKLRKEKGKAGRKRVKKYFHIDNCVNQYFDLYKGLT